MTASDRPADRARLLRIYLNDHLTGLVVGVQLAGRCLSNNGGTPLASTLEHVVIDFREDRALLEDVMNALGAPIDRMKLAGGVVAERLARLKLNGRLRGYSDLSRVVELEGLRMDIEYSLSLWRTLQNLAADDGRLAAFDFVRPVQRASSRLAEVEGHRLDAARQALSSST